MQQQRLKQQQSQMRLLSVAFRGLKVLQAQQVQQERQVRQVQRELKATKAILDRLELRQPLLPEARQLALLEHLPQ
jgi:hypothetical protein